MVNRDAILNRLFGELHFYVYQGKREFAEIKIEDKMITIKITNPIVLIAAIINHMLRKKRFASYKLKALRDAGYSIRIVYKKFKYELK